MIWISIWILPSCFLMTSRGSRYCDILYSIHKLEFAHFWYRPLKLRLLEPMYHCFDNQKEQQEGINTIAKSAAFSGRDGYLEIGSQLFEHTVSKVEEKIPEPPTELERRFCILFQSSPRVLCVSRRSSYPSKFMLSDCFNWTRVKSEWVSHGRNHSHTGVIEKRSEFILSDVHTIKLRTAF